MHDDYFMFLLKDIDGATKTYTQYSMLLQQLYFTNYTYVFDSDRDRACSGINMRSAYCYTYGLYSSDAPSGPCSVLEMLVALMDDLCQVGDTKEHWFDVLFKNLGLSRYTNQNYNYDKIDHIIDIWLSHRYQPDGHGSPFVLSGNADARNMTLWDQMNEYLNEQVTTGALQ